jgi:HSP20 family molecular chaperone IbpA
MWKDETDLLSICKQKLGSELLGFEDFIERIIRIRTNANYPPFNIVKIDEEHLAIVVAVAGFFPQELSIQLDGMQLNIKGTKEREDQSDYLYKGIASRSFQKSFLLGEGMIVKDAKFHAGLLEIILFKPLQSFKSIQIPIREEKFLS